MPGTGGIRYQNCPQAETTEEAVGNIKYRLLGTYIELRLARNSPVSLLQFEGLPGHKAGRTLDTEQLLVEDRRRSVPPEAVEVKLEDSLG
jgi:hypothetical protein